jgi:PPP family 3-phenylpropionic acid transporter
MSSSMTVALYYFLYIGTHGFWMPYFSAYLTTIGLTPAQATCIQALFPVASLLTPPLVGWLADWLRMRGRLLRWATTATAISFLGFFPLVERPRSVLSGGLLYPVALHSAALATLIFAFCRAPLVSLIDATAHECVSRQGGSYGRLRQWGSLGFLIAVLSGGALTERYGMDQILAVTALGLALTTACVWMPAFGDMAGAPAATAKTSSVPDATPRPLAASLALLRTHDLWLLLTAVMLSQMAGASYDAAFSIHLLDLGFGPSFVGVAWSIGVLAEIMLLAVSGAVMKRFGAAHILSLSLAISAIRWFLLGRVCTATAILALQPLHGITFGWFYAAATTLVHKRSGDSRATSGQGWLTGAIGLGSLLGMSWAGVILERAGGCALYTAAAGLAALATTLTVLYARRARRVARALPPCLTEAPVPASSPS